MADADAGKRGSSVVKRGVSFKGESGGAGPGMDVLEAANAVTAAMEPKEKRRSSTSVEMAHEREAGDLRHLASVLAKHQLLVEKLQARASPRVSGACVWLAGSRTRAAPARCWLRIRAPAARVQDEVDAGEGCGLPSHCSPYRRSTPAAE